MMFLRQVSRRWTLVMLSMMSWCLEASTTTAWEMNTFQDFLRGRFEGVSLSREGQIALAPKVEPLFASEQPYIWAVSQAPDESFYVGTGHRGRIYRVDARGASTLIWTAPEPEIFALAVSRDGIVYAGTSPDGKVYRIQNGQSTEYFLPKVRYIWSLAIGADGALYVGTGDGGKIFRVSGPGAGEVYYDTGQSHVTCLSFDKEGRLLAGSEPNGVLYRITGKDRAFVLYDANLPEIRSITMGSDGAIYAAALGGSVAQRTAAAAQSQPGSSPVTAPGTSITVTDEAAAQAGLELKPKQVDAGKAPATAVTSVATYAAPLDVSGVEKSAIYKIMPDNTVETLWSSKDENIYDILVSGNNLLFSTDEHGRIYRMSPDHRVTLVAQTEEGETIRLAAAGSALIAATGTMGKLYRLSGGLASSGKYESPVHDAGSVSKWGQLSWRGRNTATTKLTFRTRSGNSARPDRTWSDWSSPVSNPDGSAVGSPNARFVQWRADLSTADAISPTITGVSLSYLPQNNAPVVKSLNVTTQIAPTGAATKAAAQPQATAGTYSITVTDTGEAGASTLSGTPTQTVSRGMTQQIQVTWQAEDLDGDRLVYALYFRGEDESLWKTLRTNFTETSLIFEGDVFADGKYVFRLIASDRPSNPGSAAREAELISAPVLFDNTAPVLHAGTPKRNGASVELDVEASDAASGLRRAEYSVDATAWQPLEAADGVIDGRHERFQIRLDNLTPGEHLIVVRAYDSSNNAGLTKTIVR